MKARKILNVLILFILCASSYASETKLLRIATTTSTENSGLLSTLLPAFTRDSGYKVHVIAVGTGKALRLGKNGDVDVVLVHAPSAEKEFVASGFGVKRIPVMYNDFIVVGPENDPAKLADVTSITRSFAQIRDSQSLFLSRGDNSGTHKKELSIWKKSSIKPSNAWYREVGQGMGKLLQMANELDAYTLTDRGTWLAYQGKTQLQISYEGDKFLHNPYAIIAVSPELYPDININGSTALINWITSKTGQQMIGKYEIFGNRLFSPIEGEPQG